MDTCPTDLGPSILRKDGHIMYMLHVNAVQVLPIMCMTWDRCFQLHIFLINCDTYDQKLKGVKELMIFEQNCHCSPAQNQNGLNFNAHNCRLFGHLQEYSKQFFDPQRSYRLNTAILFKFIYQRCSCSTLVRNLSLFNFGGKTSQRDVFHHTLLTSPLLRTLVVM